MARVAIPGSFGTVGGVVTFTPTDDLPDNETIYVTITTALRGTANERLLTDLEMSFDTIVGGLEVDTITPADEATEIAVDSTIVITFTKNGGEAVVIDGTTVNATNLPILDGTSTQVPGTYATDGNEVTFTPTDDLGFNDTITVTVSVDVKGTDDEVLAAAFEASFLTIGDTMAISATDPVDEAIDVAIDSTIEVTFDTNIDETTATSSTFIVEYDDGVV